MGSRGDCQVEHPREVDTTGQDRLVWNILSSWGGHLVFIVAGFVMPRMIDRRIGQASLGIWDFSWALVNYFSFANLGVGSSVNRYVAKLRAAGDVEGLNEAVSSVFLVQLAAAAAIAVMTAGAVAYLPVFLKSGSGVDIGEARWILALLGGTLVIQQSCDSFRGVMTGCHRWDLHNGINAASYGVTVAIILVLLVSGFGLRALSTAYLAVGVVTEVIRIAAVRRICPELSLSRKKATWSQAKAMLSFGLKTIVMGLSELVVVQGSCLLIAKHLGPLALAVFSRPLGLARNAKVFINKFALVMTPTAGSLQGAGRERDIRDLVIRSTRYSVALACTIALFLSVMGDPILEVWMGSRYEAGPVVVILVAGFFLAVALLPAKTILIGVDAHGVIGKVMLLMSTAALGAGAVLFSLRGGSLLQASAVVALAMTADGAAIFWYACRHFGISAPKYFRRSFLGPLCAGVVHAGVLLWVRMALKGRPLEALGAAAGASLLILTPIYWTYFLPRDLRNKIRRVFGLDEVREGMGPR